MYARDPAAAVVGELVRPDELGGVQVVRELVADLVGLDGRRLRPSPSSVGRSRTVTGARPREACAAVSASASGKVRVLAMAVMKLASPVQRGTTWTWRCSAHAAAGRLAEVDPDVQPSGRYAALTARTASVVDRPQLGVSPASRSSRSATSRYGSTRRGPIAYGNAFRIAKHVSPRCTMWVSSSGSPLARIRVKTLAASSGSTPPAAPLDCDVRASASRSRGARDGHRHRRRRSATATSARAARRSRRAARRARPRRRAG